MDQGFLLWDHNDRLVMWNDRVTKIVPHAIGSDRRGKTFAACFRIAVRGAFPQRSEAEIEAMLIERQALRERDAVSQLELLDGRVIEIADRRTSDGRRITLYRDVTQAHRALQLIAESESRFRDAIESMEQGLILWGPDDRAVVWNERAKQLLPHVSAIMSAGIDFHDAYRRAARWAYPRMTDAEVERALQGRLDGRQRQEASQLILPDGRIIEALDRRTSVGGYITIYRDVTESRRMLVALAISEQRFRDFAETTADWFWEQDAELRFTFVSDSSHALTGLAPEAHHGRTLRETAPLGVTDAEWREHDALVARRERFAEFRIERIDPRGRRRHLSLTGKPFFDVNGAFAGYRGTGRDVTAIFEAERALDAALRKARERA
jgi:PAS domain S-box-containing protein